jgi:hypothetical protein
MNASSLFLIPFYHPQKLGEWFPPGKSKKSWRAGLSGGTTLKAGVLSLPD